jgi:cytochrome c-type biogenesis protein CcmH
VRAVFACLWMCAAFAAADNRAARIENLEQSLLAPCCYGGPVATHSSEISIKMKAEIARWVDEGRTDAQIIDTYVQRYGSRVYAPPKPVGRWVYWVPWLVLAAGGWWAVRWLRARLAPKPA